MKRKRLYKWDNVKGLLILLVVMGHFASLQREENAIIHTFFLYVYLFHMPLFLFVSGLLSQSSIEQGRGIRRRFLGYLGLAYILKLAEFLVKFAFGHADHFSFSKEWGTAWYLFVLAFYLLVTWLLRRMDREKLFFVSIVVALLIGYVSRIGGTWNLSRFFVFYPVFLLGTMWDLRCYGLRGRDRQRRSRAAALGILLAVGLLIYWKLDGVSSLDLLFQERLSYADSLNRPAFGCLYRMGNYIFAALVSVCVVILTPGRRHLLTVLGKRSLSIYMYHRVILYLLTYLKWTKLLAWIWPAHWKILFMLFSVILTVILAYPVFEIPLKKYWEGIGWLDSKLSELIEEERMRLGR